MCVCVCVCVCLTGFYERLTISQVNGASYNGAFSVHFLFDRDRTYIALNLKSDRLTRLAGCRCDRYKICRSLFRFKTRHKTIDLSVRLTVSKPIKKE